MKTKKRPNDGKRFLGESNSIANFFIVFILVMSLAIILVCSFNSPPTNILEKREVSLSDSVESTINSVVHIRSNTGNWQGSGVAVTPSIIVTARHVVEDTNDFTVTLHNGLQVHADRAVSNKSWDIGFIRLQYPILKPVQFGSITECRLAQTVYAIGSPYGIEQMNSVTVGVISYLCRTAEEIKVPPSYGWAVTFQTDAAGHPGNSGCPVFTTDGKVRGILVGGLTNAIVLCIPSDVFMREIKSIELLFALDQYEFEEVPIYDYSYWDTGYNAF